MLSLIFYGNFFLLQIGHSYEAQWVIFYQKLFVHKLVEQNKMSKIFQTGWKQQQSSKLLL